MKSKIKKIISIILIAIMLLSTSSGVIATEIKMRIFKTNRSNNVTYEYRADGITYPYIEDYEVASIDGNADSSYRSYSYFCLSGGTPLRDPGSNLGTYNLVNTWENCSSDIFNNSEYGYSNEQNKQAFYWLILNMYSEADDAKTKEYMLNNLNNIIKVYNPDKNYDVRNLDSEMIEVIEQFVIWQFVNNSPKHNEYIGSVADVQQIYINGQQYINKHEETAYALYEALRNEAINQNNGILKESYNTQYQLKLSGNIKNVTKVDGEDNTYTMGPMTLTTNPQISNLKIIKDIEDSLSVKTTNISYLDATGKPLSIASKKDLIGKTYFVKFKTENQLSPNKNVTYKCMADFGYKINSIIANVYENTSVTKQPILQLKKSIVPNKSAAAISAKTVNPFDIALTKQILKVERYNDNSNQYELVASLDRLKEINTDLIETRGTAGYIMDKRPVNVQIGDKITYRIIVYNEGNQTGKIINVTDYLPEGLTLLKEETNNVSVNKNLGIQLGNDVNDSQKDVTFAVNLNCPNQIVIDVVCQVNDKAKIGENLLNYAAVTGYQDSVGRPAIVEGIDRDSESNDSNRADYEAHYQSVVNHYLLKEIIDGGQIDKTFLNIQDDDDYEIVRVGEFDLALRKFITTVKSSDGTTRTIENREPKFDLYSSIALVSKGTALYHHEKDTVDVNIGDNVIYTLRVYNEGFQNGYAKEITDYLPAGLELMPYTAGDGSINAKYGWTETKNSDGTSTIKTTAAADTVIEAGMSIRDSGSISAAVAEAILPGKDPTGSDVTAKFYTDVQVECRVTGEASGVLVNVAEISNYGYKNASGQYVEANTEGIDRDSVEDNVIKDIDRYHDLVIEPQFDLGLSHFVGIEDDDDFESIKVPEKEITGEFNLELIKYIKGTQTPLEGAKFNISIKDETSKELVNQNIEYITNAAGKLPTAINIPIESEGKTYTVTIEEEYAPTGYKRIENPIIIPNVKAIKSDDKYVLEPQTPTIENTKSVDVQADKIIVELENEEIEYDGKFGLRLIKYEKGTQKKLSGAEFNISIKDEEGTELVDQTKNPYITANGQISISELDITAEGKTYTVELEETKAPEGYNKIEGKISFNATSTKNGDKYVLNSQRLNLENTKSVNVRPNEILVELEDDVIPVEGEFSLKLVKYEKGTQNKLSGAEFNISIKDDQGIELVDQTKNPYITANGEITISGLNITAEGKTYTVELEEIKAPEGYNKIEGKISFNATSVKVGNTYELNSQTLNLENTKIVDIKSNEILVELEDETIPVEGNFTLKLIKYLKGTQVKLSGAEFNISIKDEEGTELINSENNPYVTNNGEILISQLPITGENKTYTVSIEETKAPEGYNKIEGKIEFEVKSTKSGYNYVLVGEDITVENTKNVEIDPAKNEVLVELENIPEGPHKGVKEVTNQNSGYDKDELQDWVITTKLPKDITKFNTYIITDKIDSRLVFSGLDSVRVSIDGTNLNNNVDYKLDYSNDVLKVSFIEGNFKGQNLPEGKIIEIRFNTTFKLDENGKIIALNQSVPNQAELDYGNNEKLKTEIPEVHTGGVGVYKYDSKTGNALAGAKFKIAKSQEDAKNKIFVKDAQGKDLEIITNEKGIGVFEGLEFGEDALNQAKYKTTETIYGNPVYRYDWTKVETTYYIVETEAPEGYNKIDEIIPAIVKKDNYDINNIETLIKVGNIPTIFDLSLRKFVTKINDKEITSRIPQVDIKPLVTGKDTTANYNHPKDPVLVAQGQLVTYTIRVYNEGPEDAYASLIKDDIPEGLEFISYTAGDGSTNATYRWKLLDENDKEVTDVSKAKYIVSDYLSKEQEVVEGENLLKAFNKDTMKDLDYRDVKVQFKVLMPNTSDRVIINYAQISKETDSSGKIVTDRDSTPNVWKDEDDEDIEKIKVQYFDLALRKWVTQAIVTENGKTVVTQTGHKAEDDPEDIVKVDLKKSKINDVTVKFKYSIRVTNEGEIAGEATEIRDDIPQGLKFIQEDNPDWKEENGKIVTDKLAGVTLAPGESAEVEILLTWINSTNNMGVKVNVAEISKDHNDFGVPDIDSTPGNYVPGEDDIDDAPVMLTVKTGSEYIAYLGMGLAIISIITIGSVVIKRRILI